MAQPKIEYHHTFDEAEKCTRLYLCEQKDSNLSI